MLITDFRLAIDEKALGEILEEIYQNVIPEDIIEQMCLDDHYSSISPQELRTYLDNTVSALLKELEINVLNI